MLILKDQLLHMPIMSLQTGTEIAQTSAFIIDPRQLKVVAFYCEGSRLDFTPAILSVVDIREISDVGLIVDDADVLMSPDDLVRLKEVLGFKFELIGKRVVDETRRKIGKVINFTLDGTTLYIAKIQVQPGVWQAWKTTELLIDRTQIVEVSDTEVVVKSTTKKARVQQPTHAAPVLDNPFRHAPVENSDHHEG